MKKSESKPATPQPESQKKFDVFISWEKLLELDQVIDKNIPAAYGRIIAQFIGTCEKREIE